MHVFLPLRIGKERWNRNYEFYDESHNMLGDTCSVFFSFFFSSTSTFLLSTIYNPSNPIYQPTQD